MVYFSVQQAQAEQVDTTGELTFSSSHFANQPNASDNSLAFSVEGKNKGINFRASFKINSLCLWNCGDVDFIGQEAYIQSVKGDTAITLGVHKSDNGIEFDSYDFSLDDPIIAYNPFDSLKEENKLGSFGVSFRWGEKSTYTFSVKKQRAPILATEEDDP